MSEQAANNTNGHAAQPAGRLVIEFNGEQWRWFTENHVDIARAVNALQVVNNLLIQQQIGMMAKAAQEQARNRIQLPGGPVPPFPH